jgi:hypothetical protein
MKKYFKIIFTLLLLFRSVALSHASLGISYTNGEATVTWTNNNPATAYLYGLVGLQSTTSLTPPIIWTDVPFYFGTQSVTLPATGSQQFFRVPIIMPLFQFAIFYNMNLETAAAQTMFILGPVFSNGGLWSGSDTITFANTVSAVGLATNAPDDPFCPGYDGSGKSTYDISGQPTSGNPPLTPFDAGLNPSTAEAFINLPPLSYALGTAAAFTTDGQSYLANATDLFLTNAAAGTNFGNLRATGNNAALYYQDSANSPLPGLGDQ